MKNENEERKIITIFNFECKNCKTKIGQFVSDGVDENKIVCPECGSDNITYGTLLK